MKFPRTAKILGSQSDAAPYAAVFFLLVIFMLVAELLPTPGVGLSLVNLPVADNLSGVNQPAISVAIDCSNRLYFANQLIAAAQLKASLSNAVSRASAPLTLVIQADKTVSYDEVLQLSLLARDAGITNALLATLPRTLALKAIP
ncbi:MAG TPA: biopolymer transporter ExbD [Candidatus Angelobacter sp.]|jgi:biopolymer transport protein ExbD|nr:biopolymer transporter ExbD [Candidatus Angelobacter sp.]